MPLGKGCQPVGVTSLVVRFGRFFLKVRRLRRSKVRREEALPAAFQLSQNYPNPFNPTTTIKYAIPQPQDVTLHVYDALGRQVVTLVDGPQNAGRYEVRFDARGLPNGVYYYELRAGTFGERKAMVLLR